MEVIKSWLLYNITDTLAEFLGQFLDVFGSLINYVFWFITVISDTEEVQVVLDFTVELAYILLIAATLKQIIDIYGFHSTGDANESPVEVIYRASISSLLIAASELFYTMLFKFTKNLGLDVGKATTQTTITSQCEGWMLGSFAAVGVVLVFIIIIAIIFFYIIAGIRAAQLMLFKMLFPIFAIDRSFSNKERWSNFFQSYVSCFLGFVLQLLCFNMFRLSFTRLGLMITEDLVFGLGLIRTFGWLLLAIKAPSWLDKYAFKSGVGEGLNRALSQAGSILMMRAI